MSVVNAMSMSEAPPPADPGRALRETADRLVGTVFYGTLLKQTRASALKGRYGHGGRGEDVFAGQLHQVFAEEAGKARGSSLSDAIVRQFERQAEAFARFSAQQQATLEALRREMSVSEATPDAEDMR